MGFLNARFTVVICAAGTRRKPASASVTATGGTSAALSCQDARRETTTHDDEGLDDAILSQSPPGRVSVTRWGFNVIAHCCLMGSNVL